MNYIKMFMLLFISIGFALDSNASSVEQKLIVIKGDKSFLMDGDAYKHAANKPRGYSRDSVLPALLSVGWRIRSVNVNEKSTEEDMYGYIVIEKSRK